MIKSLVSFPGVSQLAHYIVHRARPAANAARMPTPRGVRSVTARVRGRHFVMLGPDRCVVAKELYWGRGVRPAPADQKALDVFYDLATGSDLVVDIGAYTGIFTLVAAKASNTARIRGFEIIPANYLAAQANLIANNLVGDRVTMHLAGIGQAVTEITVPTGEGGSALPDFYSSGMTFGAGVSVPMTTLDELVDDVSDPQRVLLKIDVEGEEGSIIRNGMGFLRKFVPVILCEVLRTKADLESLNTCLQELDYEFYLVTDFGLKRQSTIHGDERFRDWLFVGQRDLVTHQRLKTEFVN